MKNSLVLSVLLAITLWACKNDGVQQVGGGPNSDMINNPATAAAITDTNQLARITFEEPEFDFGEALENTIVTHSFKFTNTGKVPLSIYKARSSCGCTVPEWPKDPIPPGGTGEIIAKFNTEGKSLNQSKFITILANTYPNESKVKLKGFVKPVKDKK